MRDLIRKHFGKRSKEINHKIMVHTMKYLFRIVSAHEMTRNIRVDLDDDSVRVIDYRKAVQEGYVIKNIKFWIWYIIANNLSKKKAMKVMHDFGIKDSDKMLAFVAKKNLNEELVKLAKRYDAHTLKEFQEIEEKCLKENQKYVRKFAYKKMRFITNDGPTLDDIIMDLNYWGFYTIVLQYPQIDSMEHCQNLYRRGVHNHGINRIKNADTMKNKVLIQENDGTFSNNKVSYEVLAGNQHQELSDPAIGSNPLDIKTRVDEVKENKLFVSKMLKEHSGKRNKFLKLMSGTHSEKFSDFLSCEGYIENNDELFDRLLSNDNIDLYISLCAKWLNITPYQATQFLDKLRNRYSEDMYA